jgi:peptidyl-prolyl cis-trans isomerase D
VARQQALFYLIDRQNLLALAKKTGRETSQEELIDAVKTNPMFMVDGRFSLTTYQDLVPRLFNRSLAAFEANLSEDLLIGDTSEFLKSLNFVPIEAVYDEYHFTNDKLILDYAFFPESAYETDQVPTEAEIVAFYSENLELFRTPAKVSLKYAEVDFADFIDQVEVTEDDLANAYFDERETLSKPEEATVSQILIRFPSLSPTEEERAEAEKKAQEAFERSKTEDFKALAQELSQDTASASQGGSMGAIRRGQNLPQIEDYVFGEGKDNLGQPGGPVLSIFGYHVLLVEDYSPAHQPTLEEAKTELTEIVTQRKARRLAVNRIEDLIDILPTSNLDAQVFADTASSIGLETKDTELFGDASDAPPFLAEDDDLVRAALETPIGQAGDPVENPERIILYTPIEKLESFVKPVEDETVRPIAIEAWQKKVSRDLTLEAAKNFIKSSESLHWEDMIGDLPALVEVNTTEPFSRMQFYSAGAYLAETDPASLAAEFFKLSVKGDLIENPIRVEAAGNEGYVVLAVSDVEEADPSLLSEGELYNLQTTAKAAISNSAYEWWTNFGRVTAKVQLPVGLQAMIEGRDLLEAQ